MFVCIVCSMDPWKCREALLLYAPHHDVLHYEHLHHPMLPVEPCALSLLLQNPLSSQSWSEWQISSHREAVVCLFGVNVCVVFACRVCIPAHVFVHLHAP